MILIDIKLEFLVDCTANVFVNMFRIQNHNFAHTYPLSSVIDARLSDNNGETIAIINIYGVGKAVNGKGFKTGEFLNLTGILFY